MQPAPATSSKGVYLVTLSNENNVAEDIHFDGTVSKYTEQKAEKRRY